MSTIIPFGEWLPDLPPFGLQGATVAFGVIPEEQSYRPFPSLVTGSNPIIGGVAIGGIFATDINNTQYNFAADRSALYSLVSGSFSVVTRLVGGGYTTGIIDFWEFANWGNTIIGVNGFTDLPQQITLGAANFVNLSVGVKARHIAVLKDFVVLGNVSDSATNLCRIRWSAINNPTDFTPSAATLSDYQDLPTDGGQIQRIVGGEYGVILQERSIWRMTFVGSPLVFQFDRVHSNIGAYIPQGVAVYQNLVFFLAEDGFYSFDGSNLNPIGRGKVDQFFHSDLNTTSFHQIVTTIDPTNKIVLWGYPNTSSTGYCNRILCYSWAYNRWTLVGASNITYLFQTINQTGIIVPSAFIVASNQLGYFNGSAVPCTVSTGEFQPFPDERAMLTEVRPIIDANPSVSVTCAVFTRNRLTESLSVGATTAGPNTTGFVPTRASGRYFVIEMRHSNGNTYDHLMGVEVTSVPGGKR